MKLGEYLDEAKLAGHVNRGLVTARNHNTLPLTIYCYSKKAVYGHHWDDITTKTRGLIVSKEGDIVARPYEKFWALGQDIDTDIAIAEADELYGPPVITEKVNGCLGIFWKYGVHWGIASKGSFHSPHAEFATKWMEDHIEHNGKLVFPDGYTPVFEIICQEIQPHVIKYPKDGLILLNFIKIDTGEELSPLETWQYAQKNTLDIASVIDMKFLDAVKADSGLYEGYVATFIRYGQTPLKLKIKFPTFIANRRKFYAEQKLATLPVKKDGPPLIAKEIVTQALTCCTTRKEFADYFNRPENKFVASECFKILDYDKKDNCEVCHGANGGVRGNENVVDGVIMCDYCHVKQLNGGR